MTGTSGGGDASSSGAGGGGLTEYHASLVRERSNAAAAAELASLMWVLAHEMSLEDYGTVESQVFTAVFALVHSSAAAATTTGANNKNEAAATTTTISSKERRMAGLAALDALLVAPSADEERKAIKFANTLSNSAAGGARGF